MISDGSQKLKEEYEQYYTPDMVAEYMAGFFSTSKKSDINILDAGAGEGNLINAFIKKIIKWESKPKRINIVLYEIDLNVKQILEQKLGSLVDLCHKNNIRLIWEVRYVEFIGHSVELIMNNSDEKYDYIILNPPYKKLGVATIQYQNLLKLGMNIPNLYAAFVGISIRMLRHRGELVAITPRSFCNGVYFRQFREYLKENISFKNIHLFDSRTAIFRADKVLQEIVIYHCSKEKWNDNKKVRIIHSNDDKFDDIYTQEIKSERIIYPTDSQKIIRIVKTNQETEIIKKIEGLPCTYEDLGLQISTGPIVDFREKKDVLSNNIVMDGIPYIGAKHIKRGRIEWPLKEAKYNSIRIDDFNRGKMKDNENYVLIKRISSKEELRRIMAGVLSKNQLPYTLVGFDNKINYVHRGKDKLTIEVARGLCLYLSSSIVDIYFRIFSGHTQVNVADLKSLKYPSLYVLEKVGKYRWSELPTQQEIDELIERVVFC